MDIKHLTVDSKTFNEWKSYCDNACVNYNKMTVKALRFYMANMSIDFNIKNELKKIKNKLEEK